MINKEHYELALNDDDQYFRQSFLDSIVVDDIKKYVRRVVYVPKTIIVDKDYEVGMRTIPSNLASLNIHHTRSKIIVFEPAFTRELHPHLDDFLSTLIDHEGHHAKEYYENPSLLLDTVWQDLYETFIRPFTIRSPEAKETHVNSSKKESFAKIAKAEIRALANELEHSGFRDISPEYAATVMKNYSLFMKVMQENS
jgi:hypothetical protein